MLVSDLLDSSSTPAQVSGALLLQPKDCLFGLGLHKLTKMETDGGQLYERGLLGRVVN